MVSQSKVPGRMTEAELAQRFDEGRGMEGHPVWGAIGAWVYVRGLYLYRVMAVDRVLQGFHGFYVEEKEQKILAVILVGAEAVE